MKLKKKSTKHAPITQFKRQQGELLLNGIGLSRVKLIAGQTPFYAYDRSVISNKIEYFRQLMPSALKLHYAIKANPMPALLCHIAPLVDGLDVASGKELHLALNSGMLAKNISFAGPGKQIKELQMAVASEITINIESVIELERVTKISELLGIKAKVAIRVNPDFELKSSGMKMGGGSQQFGIDAEKVPHLLSTIQDRNLEYKGLHIFTGSQNLNADAIILTHQNIFELATRIQRSSHLGIQSLNIGGGLGIPYFPGDNAIQIEPIGAALDKHVSQFSSEFGSPEISMELGRYLVGESGVYVAEITDVKESRGTLFAVMDGGLHQHLSASGNFGQVIRKNYPVTIEKNHSQINEIKTSEPKQAIQIVGPLCTPLDLIANKYELPLPEIGDLVVVYQSGAYGYSASPRDFLSHPQPIELLI